MKILEKLFYYTILALIIGSIFISCLANSEEDPDISLFIDCWAYHNDRDKDYNETNNCLGIKYNQYFASKFNNSFDDDAYWIGIYKEYWINPYIHYGPTAGLLIGYDDIPFMVAPRVSLETKVVSFDIHWLPGLLTTLNVRVNF